jgi:hypothetical protein
MKKECLPLPRIKIPFVQFCGFHPIVVYHTNTDTRLLSNTTARSAINLVGMVAMKVLPPAQDPYFLEIYAEYSKKITTSEVIKNSHAVAVAKITLKTLTCHARRYKLLEL